jgi:hypothetical protein
MNEDDGIDDLIDDLVEIGALVKNDEPVNGEIVYNVNPERMQEVMPSFHELFMEEVEKTMLDLYQQGLVNIEYDENLNAMYSLTEEGQKFVDNMILSDRID